MRQHHTTMTKDNTALILTRLETGFHANAATLKALENDLAGTMESAREAGSKLAPSPGWNAEWQRRWDDVMGSVRRINVHLYAIGDLVDGNDGERIGKALAAWETAQLEDAELLATLRVIRGQAAELEAPWRKKWNQLARLIESNLETIHSSAQALRVKLELLKKYTVEDVENLVGRMRAKASPQPGNSQVPAEPFDRDYRNAVLDREQDQHVFNGLLDVIKGLSLWVESPNDRMRKNRALTLDEA